MNLQDSFHRRETGEIGSYGDLMTSISQLAACLDHTDKRRETASRALGAAAAAEHLIAEGACCVIAGCTEIPLVLKNTDVSVPLMDTLELLAAAAVAYALEGTADHAKS